MGFFQTLLPRPADWGTSEETPSVPADHHLPYMCPPHTGSSEASAHHATEKKQNQRLFMDPLLV